MSPILKRVLKLAALAYALYIIWNLQPFGGHRRSGHSDDAATAWFDRQR